MNIIREKIWEDVIMNLKKIRQSNGYYTTVEKIERMRFMPADYNQFPAIFAYDLPDRLTRTKEYVEDRTMTIVIQCWVKSRDRENLGTLINKFMADVKKNLMTDTKRGGVAIDTRQTDRDPYLSEPHPNLGGIQMMFEILYRERMDDAEKTI